jgi:uncharacterized membrane protein YkoI
VEHGDGRSAQLNPARKFHMTTSRIALIVLAGALGVGGITYAATQAQAVDEVTALKASIAAASIDLPQAIAFAEAHVKGKAVKAELADEHGKSGYEIEVLVGDRLMDVVVDSRDGKILSAAVDKADHDEHDDKD